jgi:hypothetical protein
MFLIMSATMFVFWLLVGMTGTLPSPHSLTPPERPPGRTLRPWLVSKAIGGVAGIIGGVVYTQVFLPQDPIPSNLGIYAATTAVGAFVASRLATDTYGQFFNRPR